MDRREFLQATVTALAATPSWALSGAPARHAVQGANDRIRVAIIGTGSRGNQVMQSWLKHADSTFVALCDVAKDRLDNTAAKLASANPSQKVEAYEDYRRILERKDVDAVLIATPDHWHSPMTVDACAAGKDVYCEKPVSNQIEPALKMLDAARKYNRVVQIGLQQRSWPHFQEAAKLVQGGAIGAPNHVVMAPPGGGGGGAAQQPVTPTDPPPTLNWDMFQGPAPRKPFVQQRLGWRGWYDYGGGNITDWGVHIVDVMNWYLKMDEKTPQIVHAVAQYVRQPRNPERVPDTYVVTMQYDNLVATLSNAALFGPDNEPWWGNYFYGDRALMLVNREGYEVRPRRAPAGRGGRGGGATPPGGGAGAPPPAAQPELLAKAVKVGFAGGSGDMDPSMVDATAQHIRNFLDCIRSRQRPNADIAIGFNSTLPTLLAIESIKAGGRAMAWDPAARRASAV
jgi:predicted dehydrogenase